MKTSIINQFAKRFYFGTPQIDNLQAFTVDENNGLLNYGTFTNTSTEESKVTITLNDANILHEQVIGAGENKVLPFNIVLEAGDIVYIKQSIANAVNITLNGSIG